MMTSLVSTLFMFSVLVPTKLWFPPDQAVTIHIKADAPVKLTMTDFAGKPVETTQDASISAEKDVDLRKIFSIPTTGTYLLYAVPQGKQLPEFVGTPLVVEQRADRSQSGLLVTRVEPLRYAKMETDGGSMTMAFYYDVAPNTVTNFLRLSDEGYFDGIGFHRIVPGFVLQAGDPLSADVARAGTGGPGFTINPEFNARPHLKGVLSMARQGDAGEGRGNPPGFQAANSGSSQFFICISYDRTKALDGKYTTFGRVVEGLDVIDKLGATPVNENDRPTSPVIIKKVTVKPVTPGDNPYSKLSADK